MLLLSVDYFYSVTMVRHYDVKRTKINLEMLSKPVYW